jgi:hemerythrin-like domain-containing protein
MSIAIAAADFDVLDACHKQILVNLGRLAGLIDQVASGTVDSDSRDMAGVIEKFFSGTARAHHQEEAATVFPPLLSSDDAALVNVVRTLQQDHGWIEEDWITLGPQLRAIASGNNWVEPAEFLHDARIFMALCNDHIALEESLIYPRAKSHWSAVLSLRASSATR